MKTTMIVRRQIRGLRPLLGRSLFAIGIVPVALVGAAAAVGTILVGLSVYPVGVARWVWSGNPSTLVFGEDLISLRSRFYGEEAAPAHVCSRVIVGFRDWCLGEDGCGTY